MVVQVYNVECIIVFIHIMLDAHEYYVLSVDTYILEVIIECLTCYEHLWSLPDVAAASLNEPLLTFLRYLSKVFALLVWLQPFFSNGQTRKPFAKVLYPYY